MSVQLNIKSEDAKRLATELAELRGESLTAAVTRALRSALEQERRQRDRAELRARLKRLAGEIHANMAEPASSDHDWLYDAATGLPV